MRAVLLKKSRSVVGAEFSELAVPHTGRGEVLVEMRACGLCGTDMEKIRGEYTSAMPVIGHEAVGVVSLVGEGVSNLKEGDRVFPHHHVPCYECYFCRQGDETICPHYKTSNLDPGGFSEYIRVPAWNVSRGGVVRLPERVSFEEGTLVEPLACCVRALDRCVVKAGDSVLVVGAGPIGMMHALLLKSMGATVLVSDVARPRLTFAARASVGTVINARREKVPESVGRETSGRGVDFAIVASGSREAAVQALSSVRKGGTVCLFGIPAQGSVIDFDLSKFYNSTVRIISSYGAVEADVSKAIKLLSGRRRDFTSLITHRFKLQDFGMALKAMTGGEAMKVIVTP